VWRNSRTIQFTLPNIIRSSFNFFICTMEFVFYSVGSQYQSSQPVWSSLSASQHRQLRIPEGIWNRRYKRGQQRHTAFESTKAEKVHTRVNEGGGCTQASQRRRRKFTLSSQLERTVGAWGDRRRTNREASSLSLTCVY